MGERGLRLVFTQFEVSSKSDKGRNSFRVEATDVVVEWGLLFGTDFGSGGEVQGLWVNWCLFGVIVWGGDVGAIFSRINFIVMLCLEVGPVRSFRWYMGVTDGFDVFDGSKWARLFVYRTWAP